MFYKVCASNQKFRKDKSFLNLTKYRVCLGQ